MSLIGISPTEAAALHRLLQTYLASEEADPGLPDLTALYRRLDRGDYEMDHSRYIAALGGGAAHDTQDGKP